MNGKGHLQPQHVLLGKAEQLLDWTLKTACEKILFVPKSTRAASHVLQSPPVQKWVEVKVTFLLRETDPFSERMKSKINRVWT